MELVVFVTGPMVCTKVSSSKGNSMVLVDSFIIPLFTSKVNGRKDKSMVMVQTSTSMVTRSPVFGKMTSSSKLFKKLSNPNPS